MVKLSLAESLIYSTVRITALSEGKIICFGTAFYAIFEHSDDYYMPVLITNKHVVNGADQITITCHLSEPDFYGPTGKSVEVDLKLEGLLYEHPSDIDICAIGIQPVLERYKKLKTPIFYTTVLMKTIPKKAEWKNFDAIEKVTMIGCPRGLLDEVNNHPIARQGITATSLSKPYNGKEEFMIDIACFSGSSGSPVFLYDVDEYLEGKTGKRLSGGRLFFLGILSSGPEFEDSGEITLSKNPQFKISSTMHLGFVIKSTELLALQKHTLEAYNKELLEKCISKIKS